MEELLIQLNGLPPTQRVIDTERNAALYAESVGEDEERPPGTFLLCMDGGLIKIRSYFLRTQAEGGGAHALFKVRELEIPADQAERKSHVRAMLEEALTAWAYARPLPTRSVAFQYDLSPAPCCTLSSTRTP